MDEQRVVDFYVHEGWTLRQVASEFGTNHHMVRRILARHGVAVTRANRRKLPVTDEHRAAISRACMGRRSWAAGLVMTEAFKRKVMAGKLGTARSLAIYEDFERLKLLTRLTSKHRATLGASDEARFAFIDKFYFDPAFNALYAAWIRSGKSKWWYPSLDHINPRANGGNFALDNLRFITWFENRAKADMPLAEWEALKAETNTRSYLFIEAIIAAG